MTPIKLRQTLRWIHIVGGLIVGTYLYAPWSADPAFTAVTLYGVVPLLGLSGIAMWQQGRISRWMKSRKMSAA